MLVPLQTPFRLALLLGILGLAASCTAPMTLRVEEHGDLSQYRTWDWLPTEQARVAGPTGLSPGLEADVAEQLETFLTSRGFRRVPGRAQLLVHFRVGVQRREITVARAATIQTVHSMSYSPSWEVQGIEYETKRYETAELLVVVLDAHAGTVVWRGTFVDRYSNAFSPHVSDAVSQLLAQVPAAQSPAPPGTRSMESAIARASH